MISRATIICLVLLLASGVALEVRAYQQNAPCREWKKLQTAAIQPVSWSQDGSATFNLCDGYWDGPRPVWVDASTLLFFISLTAFCGNLAFDLIHWFKRRSRRIEAEQT